MLLNFSKKMKNERKIFKYNFFLFFEKNHVVILILNETIEVSVPLFVRYIALK